MRSGSKPTKSQPPPRPPANSGRLRPRADGALNPGLDERVASLKKAIVSSLKSNKWPSDSMEAAESLVNAINSCPDISMDDYHMTKELQNLVENYTEILDDILIQLGDASSKAAMKRWKFLELIKSLASDRPSKCTLLLKTCQDDLSRATHTLIRMTLIWPLKTRLDTERAKKEGVSGGLESSPKVQVYSIGQDGSQSTGQDPATGT
ncbi:hypothetical protein FRC01_014608, partial [Tulasnella sp. 417]